MSGRTPRGATIVEMLVVIGIAALLVTLGLPFASGFGQRNDIFSARRGLLHALRRAQFRSMLSEGGTNVWVRVTAGTGTDYAIYRGTSYATRDLDSEEAYAFPETVGVDFSFPGATSTLDLRFSRYDGRPAATGTFRLFSTVGGTSTVQIGPQGQVTDL